jgi:hypothetical protein
MKTIFHSVVGSEQVNDVIENCKKACYHLCSKDINSAKAIAQERVCAGISCRNHGHVVVVSNNWISYPIKCVILCVFLSIYF